MVVVKMITRVPSRSVFKPETTTTGYLQACCKRSYRIVEDVKQATEFTDNNAAFETVNAYGFNRESCSAMTSPNQPKKKTGFF